MNASSIFERANFYYFGRRAYPAILIGVVLTAIFAVGGILAAIASWSWKTNMDETQRAIAELKFNIDREIFGTDLEIARQGVSDYLRDRPAVDAEDKFNVKLGKEARFNADQRVALLRKLRRLQGDAAKTATEEMLREFQIEEGVEDKIAREDALINFLKGFIGGAPELAQLFEASKRDRDLIPPEVLVLMERAPELAGGAKALLQSRVDALRNERGQNTELTTRFDGAVAGAFENFEKRNTTFKDLKGNLLEKRTGYESSFWSKMDEQRKQWTGYLQASVDHIANVTGRQNHIDELLREKEQLKRILDARSGEGQGWLPILDLIDGRVLSANPELGFAVIDIGREDGLRIGQGFDVFRMKGEARQETKGRLEVQFLEDRISICKITARESLNPIAAGDSVANARQDTPFDRKVRPQYALRGRFPEFPSRALVTAMIESSGGKVVNDLSERTNFLVTGDDVKQEEISLSKQLGLRVIRTADMMQHLGMALEDVRRIEERTWKFDQ